MPTARYPSPSCCAGICAERGGSFAPDRVATWCTDEGFYKLHNGLEQVISRGVAYALYAYLVWCETSTPDIGFAREFAQAVHAKHPGKLLSYNRSPSFNS